MSCHLSYSLANDGDKINYLETYMFKRILSLMIFVTLIFVSSCKTTEVTQSKKQEFTVDFAQKLQDVLQNGTIEEALALFETMPEKYQNDYSMNLLHGSLLVSARDVEKATIVVEVGLYNNNEFLYVGDKLPKIIVLNEIGVDGELTFENENEKLILGSKEYSKTLSTSTLLISTITSANTFLYR